MRYKYLDLDLLTAEDREKLAQVGITISNSEKCIDEDLYQSIALSNYIYIEIKKAINKCIEEGKLSEADRDDSEIEVSVKLSMDFKPEVEKYLKISIDKALNEIIHKKVK